MLEVEGGEADVGSPRSVGSRSVGSRERSDVRRQKSGGGLLPVGTVVRTAGRTGQRDDLARAAVEEQRRLRQEQRLGEGVRVQLPAQAEQAAVDRREKYGRRHSRQNSVLRLV